MGPPVVPPPSGLVAGLSNGRLLVHALPPPLLVGLFNAVLVLQNARLGGELVSTLGFGSFLLLWAHAFYFGVTMTTRRRAALRIPDDGGTVLIGLLFGLCIAAVHTAIAAFTFFAGCVCLASGGR